MLIRSAFAISTQKRHLMPTLKLTDMTRCIAQKHCTVHKETGSNIKV